MLTIATITLASACADSSAAPARVDLSDAELAELARRRIYFGHQSVGRDIVAGVRDILAERTSHPLRLLPADGLTVPGPAFIEGSVGENGDPLGKTRAFARVLAAGMPPGSIALHKYCYVDVTGKTDVESLFSAYRTAMAELRSAHPEVTLVHVTLPLRSAEEGGRLARYARRLLGRGPEGADVHLARARFNRLLRAEYVGREPVFDLAGIESTGRDGRRVGFRYRGETVPTLAPEWTHDGGHLNEAGRRRAAARLLAFLAGLPAEGR